jgi:cobalt-zinc-cadmium efflux system protein
MGHDHDHSSELAAGQNRRRLALVLNITGAVLVAEVVGAVLTGSLALLADAGHMLTDAVGLIMALLPHTWSPGRPPTSGRGVTSVLRPWPPLRRPCCSLPLERS